MNHYDYEFTALCPNGSLQDLYTVKLSSMDTVHVERIIAVCNELKNVKLFQEDIADMLRQKLQCRVELTGWHFGVKVTCERE